MNNKKIKVIVVYGGKSGEHEVSVRSAKSVIAAIDTSKYEIDNLVIAKNGRWVKGLPAKKVLEIGKCEGQEKDLQSTDLMPVENDNQSLTVVFPVLHGPYGEDGTIQGMFEMLNLSYVGSGVLGSSLGMDKVVQKELFAFHKLPVVPYTWFWKEEWETDKKRMLKKVLNIGNYPFFVKPANLGSSVGISKAHNEKELIKAIDFAVGFDTKILVEKGAENIREIEISVLGTTNNPKTSVCGEILPANEFYDYDAKYINENTGLSIPAKIDKEIYEKIAEYAKIAFKVLNCFGLSRVDFFLEKATNKIWINEVNTMPGFTSVSMYPKLWEAAGVSYSQLIEELIQLAILRWEERQKLKTSI